MRKWTLIVLAALMALSLVAVPSYRSASAQEGEPLKIGLMTDLTGALQLYGVELENGFMLGLEYATDGTLEVAGRPIEVIVRDYVNDPNIAATQARELIEVEGVEVLVGAPSSGVTQGLVSIAAEYGVVLMAGPAAAKNLTAELFEPTYIVDWPAEASPLARRSDSNPEIAERFFRQAVPFLGGALREFQVDTPQTSEVSETTVIPGNAGLGAAERAGRIALAYEPFHAAIEAVLAERSAAGLETRLVSVHSFTPVYKGVERPWQIGIIHDDDTRLAGPFIAALKAQGDLVVGVNEPYSPADRVYFTLESHGRVRDLPCAMIEIRNDEISGEAGQQRWAEMLISILGAVRLERRAKHAIG